MKADQDFSSLRGLLCLMLVFYHVVGGNPAHGLRIDEGVLRLLADGLSFARMPVFSALAGFAFSYSTDSGFAIIRKKARRLLVPVLVVGTLFALIRDMLAVQEDISIQTSYWHWLPVGHFWFLQSLFLIFVVVSLLECRFNLHRPINCFIVFFACCCSYMLGVATPVLGISGALYLAPFFFFGLLSSLLWGTFSTVVSRVWLLLFFILCFTVYESYSFQQRDNFFHLISGLIFSALAMRFMPQINILERVGKFSFEIFLFHVFFTAFSRSLLLFLGVKDTAIYIIMGMFLGVIGPVLLSRVCSQYSWYRVFFLGLSSRNLESHNKRKAAC